MASSSFVISSRRPSNLLLGAIVSLPTMAMTLIAPAVPALRQEFAISYNQAQLVITAFLSLWQWACYLLDYYQTVSADDLSY